MIQTIPKTNEQFETLETVMDKHIAATLERCNGNRMKAARQLGISRSTLYRILGRMNGDQKGSIRV